MLQVSLAEPFVQTQQQMFLEQEHQTSVCDQFSTMFGLNVPNKRDVVKFNSSKTESKSVKINISMTEDETKKQELKILCFDLSLLPTLAQFLLCCGGVFFFFLIYGYCQVKWKKSVVLMWCALFVRLLWIANRIDLVEKTRNEKEEWYSS